MKNQPNKISPILLKFTSYSIADIARFKGLIPQQLTDNLLVKLLCGVVESLHTLRATNGSLCLDVAEAVFAIKSIKSQACQVHKLGSAMLASDSVSCSHNSIILRFSITFTMQRYEAVLTTLVKILLFSKLLMIFVEWAQKRRELFSPRLNSQYLFLIFPILPFRLRCGDTSQPQG